VLNVKDIKIEVSMGLRAYKIQLPHTYCNNGSQEHLCSIYIPWKDLGVLVETLVEIDEEFKNRKASNRFWKKYTPE
jgi:hypothetical protein